jgi:hypothetical protein
VNYYYYYYYLRMRRHRLDALFLTQVYFGLKFCPSVLEIVGLRVPAQCIRDFSSFNVCSSCKNCPSLDVHQLLMSAGTLTYLEPGTFSLIVFYNKL